jgi:phenylacetate-CoA ligase
MNDDMPLIRYRVGDRGSRPVADLCQCGRNLPVLASIEGRTDDLIYTADGRQIGCIDTIYDANLPVREAQIIQETIDQVRVRIVAAPEFTAESGAAIIRAVRQRMGPVKVLLERVQEIPRGANAKYRAVICNLPAQVRQNLRGAEWVS